MISGNILKKFFYSFFIIWFLVSCVPSQEVSEDKVLSADRLIKRLEANRRKIKTFRGTGILDIESPELSAKANFEVLLKKPDSLKLSIFGPLGIDLAHAVIAGKSFIFYDVIRNKIHRGGLDKGALKSIFKIDLSFEDLMDAFAGSVNLTDKLRRVPDDYLVSEIEYVLTYSDSLTAKESIYQVDPENLAITGFKLYINFDELFLEGNYTDFRNFENVPIPYSTLVKNDLKKQNIKINYRNIEVNKEINNFSLSFPDDATVVEW